MEEMDNLSKCPVFASKKYINIQQVVRKNKLNKSVNKKSSITFYINYFDGVCDKLHHENVNPFCNLTCVPD